MQVIESKEGGRHSKVVVVFVSSQPLSESNLPLAQPFQEDANPFKDVLKHSINHLSYVTLRLRALHLVHTPRPSLHTVSSFNSNHYAASLRQSDSLSFTLKVYFCGLHDVLRTLPKEASIQQLVFRCLSGHSCYALLPNRVDGSWFLKTRCPLIQMAFSVWHKGILALLLHNTHLSFMLDP